MTSPVDTSVKWARSTMPGAPVLAGQSGSIISLLDAVLVNGWGLQNATSVVVSGGFAMATFPLDHAAAVSSVVLVEGATPSALNGEQKVTWVGPNQVRWATALPDGAASGAVKVRMAPAGWSKVFSGANLAVYKSVHPQAHGQFLRVNDTATTFARVVGYETMTAVSTGTGLFPSAAQVSGGFYWGKSSEASVVAIPWSIAADARAFYFHPVGLFPNDPLTLSGAGYFFGDLNPLSQAGDPFATLMIGAPDANWFQFGGPQTFAMGGSTETAALPRPLGGVGSAVRPYIMTMGSETFDLPNKVSGRIELRQVFVRDSNIVSNSTRAMVPGLTVSAHTLVEQVIAPNSLFRESHGGVERLAMLAGYNAAISTNMRMLAVDVTGPWR